MFRDRRHAGEHLAGLLTAYRGRDDVVVLGLPRGGVPVAVEVARALGAPLDVYLVRKLGVPGHEELAMGAIATGGVLVRNDEVLRGLGILDEAVRAVAERERVELERRLAAYRGDQPAPDVAGKVVVLVDDGLATGSTMRAAIAALRHERPARIVVAVPTGATATCRQLAAEVDELVCAATPEPFTAVGLSYDDFSATTDTEVRSLLARHAPPPGTAAAERGEAGRRVPG